MPTPPTLAEITIPARAISKVDGVNYYCDECTAGFDPREVEIKPLPKSIVRQCEGCGYKPQDAVYNLVRTTAPAAYDGFGTFTYKHIDHADQATNTPYGLQGKAYRVIAVLPVNMKWQESRNRSGMHCFIPLEEGEAI